MRRAAEEAEEDDNGFFDDFVPKQKFRKSPKNPKNPKGSNKANNQKAEGNKPAIKSKTPNAIAGPSNGRPPPTQPRAFGQAGLPPRPNFQGNGNQRAGKAGKGKQPGYGADSQRADFYNMGYGGGNVAQWDAAPSSSNNSHFSFNQDDY